MKKLKVFVYKNLNKKCFSVRDVASGRVIAHSYSLILEDCTFKVSQKGSKRVKETGAKFVHAGIEGYLVINPFHYLDFNTHSLKVMYDPKLHNNFVDAKGRSISKAKVVMFALNQVFIEDV